MIVEAIPIANPMSATPLVVVGKVDGIVESEVKSVVKSVVLYELISVDLSGSGLSVIILFENATISPQSIKKVIDYRKVITSSEGSKLYPA